MRIPLAFWLVLLLGSSKVLAMDSSCHDNEYVLTQVVKVQAAPTPQSAAAEAFDLFQFVVALSDKQVTHLSDDAVDSIAFLLRNNSNSVKLQAAYTLGRLGGRGSRALPALRQALASYQEEPAPAGKVDLRPRVGRSEIEEVIRKIEANVRE